MLQDHESQAKQISHLAYQGKWSELIPLLRRTPELVNQPSEKHGYTALHQAAWHGASRDVIGELLALGSDRIQRTHSKQQTACEIAQGKHPDREDLAYLISPSPRRLAQLIRKVVVENESFFGPYDGNRVLCDRLVECFGLDTVCTSTADLDARMHAAFFAITGCSLSSSSKFSFGPNEQFEMRGDTEFWRERFLPKLRECVERAYNIPLEREWAVVADLFDPAPWQWGYRGDLFLWMEMRQALSHVAIPEDTHQLALMLTSAFVALTGKLLDDEKMFAIARFARGGMSNGCISREFWSHRFIPMMQQRFVWLRDSWSLHSC